MSDSVKAAWVVGKYEGEQAKKVMALGDSGSGYIILERGGNKLSPFCLAAFRFTLTEPIPEHLTEVVDPIKIREYEKVRKQRQGMREGS